MITVGFTLLGKGRWSGGEAYLRNMLHIISTRLAGQVRAKLFLSPQESSQIGSAYDDLLAEPAIVDERVATAGSGTRAMFALLSGSDRGFGEIVVANGIDLMFENAQWFGNRFPVPVISWLPDFQHSHLPHLFSRKSWWRRELGFRIQTSGRRTIMLSSADALADCERLYPASRGKTTVVHFAVDIDPAVHTGRSGDVRRTYHLPERYFYLPNQFWAHKNHALVAAALTIVAGRSGLGSLPPVIMTGKSDDARDPTLFGRLMDKAKLAGSGSHFRHLGLVPFEDVHTLNAAAVALINPSRFEGWSTTVEEAKALGTPMLLSDIPLHREQAPDAIFFPLDDPEVLANVLTDFAELPAVKRPDVATLHAGTEDRVKKYADAILRAFRKGVGLNT